MKVQFILISIFATGALAGSGRGHPQDLHTYASIAACAHETSVFSCENTTPIKNTCCSPTPGGLVLATQFWDTYTGLEHLGQKLPQGSWGIHGLWPDNCDGCVLTHCVASRTQAQIFLPSSFEQYCDFSRQLDPHPSPAVLPNGTVIPPYKGPGVDTFIKKFERTQLLDYSTIACPNSLFSSLTTVPRFLQ